MEIDHVGQPQRLAFWSLVMVVDLMEIDLGELDHGDQPRRVHRRDRLYVGWSWCDMLRLRQSSDFC